ncbi:MAG: molybdate ABC transporter substrate-binding protein [Terriglobia bacterium]
MRSLSRVVCVAFLLVMANALASGALWAAPASRRINVTVSAAISLSKSLQTLRELYRRKRPDVSITLNLGASGILEQQIEQGAPADIFISASPEEMNALQAKGLLLNSTRQDLLSNSLVLISPSQERKVTGFQDLTLPRVKRIAIANPESVPAGMYARETLEYLKIYRKIRPKLLFAEDVRQALAYVETDNADAALVYLTEAKLSSKVRVVATAPPASHAPIVYPIAVLKRSKNAAEAERLVQFLRGPEARQVFEQEGFGMESR